MSLNHIELKEGAFIISDAHYSHLRPQLLQLIKDIESLKLHPSQLIFMGDIFDALFGNVEHTHNINALMIKLINKISQNIEVIYLEGNHDFNLQKLFPLAKVFSLKQQPVAGNFKDKKLYFAHGDFDGTLGYRVYTSLIRNPFMLFILKTVDALTNHSILNKLDSYLGQKDDCKQFVGFKDFIKNRFKNRYQCDYFIEGHFHQNVSFGIDEFQYVNLAAFACNQRYFIVNSSKEIELLIEEKLS